MKLRVYFLASLFLCAVCFASTRRVGTTQTGKLLNTDWAQRVVANGGALPTQNEIVCMEALRSALVTQGLTNKIYALCNFVTNSVIASATPLIFNAGYPMWTNNFVSGNLNINGLRGFGTNAMDTGITATEIFAGVSSLGLAAVVTESSTNHGGNLMAYQAANGSHIFSLSASFNGSTSFFGGQPGGTDFIGTNDWLRVGFLSGCTSTNGGTTNVALFVASPLESHKLLASRVAADTTHANAGTISVFAQKQDGTNGNFTFNRMSMAAVLTGFTQTDSSNLWWAVKTCRECLGGGTGDQVHDFNTRLVATGAADLSTTSSNALRTYRTGLDARSLLYFLPVANCVLPDSLTAARMPFILQAGNIIWANVAFGSTNLTVNGLTGNGSTKYLNLGLNAATLTYGGFSSDSAGISVLVYTNPATAVNALFGVGGTAASSQFAIYNAATTDQFINWYCWKFINVNQDFVRVPNATNYSGFLSGNRTAANAIRLDLLTNGVFNVYTNATGSQTGTSATQTNLVSHGAWSSAGNAGAVLTPATISYVALHPGFTFAQSSNHWELVKELRTALGGGNPP